MTTKAIRQELPSKLKKRLDKARELYFKSEYEKALIIFMNVLDHLESGIRNRIMAESDVGAKLKQCIKIAESEKSDSDIEYEKQAEWSKRFGYYIAALLFALWIAGSNAWHEAFIPDGASVLNRIFRFLIFTFIAGMGLATIYFMATDPFPKKIRCKHCGHYTNKPQCTQALCEVCHKENPYPFS